MELAIIAIIGILVGALSNMLPFFGSTFFNFATALLITSYQSLAQKVGFPLIPESIFIFAIAYYVGTFLIKVLALLPIPFIQPIAMQLRGTK